MAASDVDTLMAAAATAVAAADYATALSKALQAQGRLSAIPDAADGMGASQNWLPIQIQNFIVNVRGQQAATIGIQRQKFARRRISNPS